MDQREYFLNHFAVSHETAQKFDAYAAMLVEAQSRMNLVAPSTLPDLWQRHFFDCAQLFELIPPQARNLVDIGSGAGFPGIVLAIMGASGVNLIDATQKKALFLQDVAAKLGLPITVHAKRAEEIKDLQADVITARAVAPLVELLPLCHHFRLNHTTLLFLKGEKAAQELTVARQNWQFDVRIVASRSGDDSSPAETEAMATAQKAAGNILILKNLMHKREVRNERPRPR